MALIKMLLNEIIAFVCYIFVSIKIFNNEFIFETKFENDSDLDEVKSEKKIYV